MLVMSIASTKQISSVVSATDLLNTEYYGNAWLGNGTNTAIIVFVENSTTNVTITLDITYNLIYDGDSEMDDINASTWMYLFNETLSVNSGFITVYPSMNNYSVIVGPMTLTSENENENVNTNSINNTIWNILGSNVAEMSTLLIVLFGIGVAAVVMIAIAQLIKAGRSKR